MQKERKVEMMTNRWQNKNSKHKIKIENTFKWKRFSESPEKCYKRCLAVKQCGKNKYFKV